MTCVSSGERRSVERVDMNALTDEEWDELFGDPSTGDLGNLDGAGAELGSRRSRVPLWAKAAAVLASAAMVLSLAPGLVQWVREIGAIKDPIEIVAHANAYVDRSEFGWLVSEVQIASLGEPNVAAYVLRNPADGVIILDNRAWQPDDLDETMAHEIGHLLDFAVWPGGRGDLRGGLESEVWAECAAVAAGERGLDGSRDNDEYRCRPAELEVFEARMATAREEMICRPWDERECR